MNIKAFAVTAFIVLISIVSFGQTNPSQTRAKLGPNVLNTARAMRDIFGTYDESIGASTWIPKDVPSGIKDIEPNTKAYSIPLVALPYEERGIAKSALIVANISEIPDATGVIGIARFPTIGVFVFSRSNGDWRLDVGSKLIFELRDVQLPNRKLENTGSPFQIFKVGPENHGIRMTLHTLPGNQFDDVVKYEYWLIPWKDTVALSFKDEGEAESIRLVPAGEIEEFFDVVVSSGENVQSYTFQDGRYVLKDQAQSNVH